MEQERRKASRIDFHLEVTLDGLQGPNKIMNFSTFGAFIQTPNPWAFREGEEIELAIKLPPEEKTIQIKARVVHVKRSGIGVKFRDVSTHDAVEIKYCFDVFKNTLPLPGT